MSERKIPERPVPNTTEIIDGGSGGGLLWAVVGLIMGLCLLVRVSWPLVEPFFQGCR